MNLNNQLMAIYSMIIIHFGYGLKPPLTIFNPLDSANEEFQYLSLSKHINLSDINNLPWKVIKVLSQKQANSSCIDSVKEFVLDAENLQLEALQSKHIRQICIKIILNEIYM